MAAAVVKDIQEQVAEWIMSFRMRPLDAAVSWYDWGEGDLATSDGPDTWQMQALALLQRSLIEGNDVHRLGVRSGHGVGKTALIAMLIHWFVSTRPHPQVVVTANTKSQLETKTWRELAVWKHRVINGDWFEWAATRYKMRGHEDTWYASAIPWSKHRAQAFAGTHAKHVMIILDEASEIDPMIWETAEGALTTPGAIMVAFGNPSQTTGKFADIWGKLRHRWMRMRVDSRTAKMANQRLIQEWIEDYGDDSDFVRVRVKGLPPKHGAKSLVSRADVDAAMERHIEIRDVNPAAPLLMGVDVARDGTDDCCILLRKGPKVHREIKVFKERDLMRTAGIVAEWINRWHPDVCFVDEVGMGAGVLDRLIQIGHDCVVGVKAGEKADKDKTYYNRRTEMWHRMALWMPNADLPNHKECKDAERLRDELTAPEFYYDAKELMRLESKKEMELRGIESPDIADSLALTFAYAVPSAQSDESSVTEPDVI